MAAALQGGASFAMLTAMSDIVRCPNCGQANRVPSLESGKQAVCGKCKTPLSANGHDAHPVKLTDASFRQEIAKGKSVVDFWAAWCGPCRMIAPVIDQLASERKDVRFGKLNIDENPATAQTFNVQSIPQLVLFRDGVEQGRVVGAVPRAQIEQAIRQYLG